MKKSGAWLLVKALEEIGVKYTFGIPGVHNTEIYDELGKSQQIEPILVTHEMSAGFMADAVSRTSNSIGTLVIVPAAGVTHAMSAIGEAFLDGIPMLIVCGGVRRDSNRQYQLHQMDLQALMSNICKNTYLITKHDDILKTIYHAFDNATGQEPGPVFVEIAVEIQIFQGQIESFLSYDDFCKENDNKDLQDVDDKLLTEAAQMLMHSKRPAIFAGWGACHATNSLIELSQLLCAPVATTLQGLSVFPASHGLHTGMGFSQAAVPAATNAFSQCDTLLAVGCRFAEIPTGSYGLHVPQQLIHIDINPKVFHANYPASIAIESDAAMAISRLVKKIKAANWSSALDLEKISALIQADKRQYLAEWLSHDNPSKTVNPAYFFQQLREALPDDAFVVADDGNHTFLTAELLPIYRSKHFISPSDFNSMGYCVPAAIGAKLANPDTMVIGIVGDGAFLMTGLEIITAASHGLGVVYFIFHDGELSQISQGQQLTYNRKVCTVLGNIRLEGIAMATGAHYLHINSNNQVSQIIDKAFRLAEKNQPVLVDVRIDYSKKTRFSKGVMKENFSRFELGEKFRFIGRAIGRKISG